MDPFRTGGTQVVDRVNRLLTQIDHHLQSGAPGLDFGAGSDHRDAEGERGHADYFLG